ncbi:topoisomerase II-associated protein PAT1 [Bisporella sp. PMI_857]|nr:topoisomerase II-associated protein PAT1 [Bisporella sp. PMI_857]
MSFFGFDSTLPRDRDRGHNASAIGFSQAADPFGGARPLDDDDDDALDFEDTYDGLGDQLDETLDDFNDDTFGDVEPAGSGQKTVGKDFDFFGQTAKVSDAINEEQLRFSRQQPISKVTAPAPTPQQPLSKPSRTGYERYKEPGYIPDMQVNADIWGTVPKRAPAQDSPGLPSSGGRKMMSLEEVEAAMRAQAKKPTPVQQQQQPPPPQQYAAHNPSQQFTSPPSQNYQAQHQYQQPPQQFPVQTSGPPHTERQFQEDRRPVHTPQQPIQILQRNAPPPPGPAPQISEVPVTILQNPDRHPTGHGNVPTRGHRHTHQSRHSNSGPVITHPQQLTNLSEEERTKFLAEDAKRAKRNHKIFMMSKDNGLMTPQDKNFITRIQLQQLVTATGNPNEHGTDSGLSEDFYYQVHNQIRGGPRQHPGQPLSNFAQTYLFQTGGRHGGMRRQARGGDNHMQRMEQQVQRAVEAAKNKPKNKQLVIEGSLGKISFSNAKTPKPLLNFKRTESGPDARDRRAPAVAGIDRKSVLADIENVYSTLMKMEDHDRNMPPPLHDDVDPELVGYHMDWREKAEKLNAQLWRQLKVHEPIGATEVHPFIAFLSFSKGKKSIQRVFRHITHQQRTTILTMIVVHLDQLDVVRQAQLLTGETLLNARIRENVELFSSAVLPSLFAYLGDAPLDIVAGVLGLVLNINVDVVARTRVGVSLLTMVLSRAELIKQGGEVNEQEWEQWVNAYNALFDLLEPTLPSIFPGTVNSGEDIYVWQFLAAIGIGAKDEQQQRLVMAVKDRVMETIALAKTLPPAMAIQRRENVNLFMRSIGLDVELLE